MQGNYPECEKFCRKALKIKPNTIAIVNNLGNALKFSRSKVTLTIQEGNGNLVVHVEDDGDGIPLELHQKIFECYFQIEGEGQHCVRGHGLGLAGVMVLIEDMGGEMLLKSDVGKGATFSVKLPLASSS